MRRCRLRIGVTGSAGVRAGGDACARDGSVQRFIHRSFSFQGRPDRRVRGPDPQSVPGDLIDRIGALPPDQVLAAPFLERAGYRSRRAAAPCPRRCCCAPCATRSPSWGGLSPEQGSPPSGHFRLGIDVRGRPTGGPAGPLPAVDRSCVAGVRGSDRPGCGGRMRVHGPDGS
jgi:hypothetical protein